jgi:hypothetical protein
MSMWKRNLIVTAAAEMVVIAGFMVIIPFLPFYVQVAVARALGPMTGAAITVGLELRPNFLCAAGIFGLAALGVTGLGLRR